MFNRLSRRAQTTAEYAVVIALVIGAVVAMQVYVKRGLQGRLKQAIDHTGNSHVLAGQNFEFSGQQLEPYYLSSYTTSNQSRQSDGTMNEDGMLDRTENSQMTANVHRVQNWTNEP